MPYLETVEKEYQVEVRKPVLKVNSGGTVHVIEPVSRKGISLVRLLEMQRLEWACHVVQPLGTPNTQRLRWAGFIYTKACPHCGSKAFNTATSAQRPYSQSAPLGFVERASQLIDRFVICDKLAVARRADAGMHGV